MTSSFGGKNHFGDSSWKFVVLTAIVLVAMTASVFGAAKFVSGLVPDWNQPYRYNAPNGPGPDPNRVANPLWPTDQWNDWCAPTSAANLAGHWTDVRGVPVADTTAFPGSTVAWGAGPSWQDYLADSNRPPPQASFPLPSPTTDIGWYMDSNFGVPYDDGSPNVMAGWHFGDAPHKGTYLKNIHVGLQLFLNNRYSLAHGKCWLTGTRGVGYFAGVSPDGTPNLAVFPDEPTAFNQVKSEINSNRTLILCFQHWSVNKSNLGVPQSGTLTNESAFGYTNYTFVTYTGGPNAEDEYWNSYDDGSALGHAVTCVGYIPAGDPADQGPALGIGQTDWVIVHDNWASTPRNVAVPYTAPQPPATPHTFNPYWVANTTAVISNTAAKFVTCLVPDWNQPYRYNAGSAHGGPGQIPPPPPPGQWSAWCAPSSAANLAGHWMDCYGAPVADTTPFDSVPFPGSTVNWAGGASWQDYLADGANRPPVQNPPCGLPQNPTDIGWYMDTNRGQPLDAGGGSMGGYCLNPINDIHVGTYLKDIHAGLGLYLNALFGQPNGPGWDTGTRGKVWAAGTDALGNPAAVHPNEASAFGEVVQEINRNHTLLLSFEHWNVAAAGVADVNFDGTNTEAASGASYYNWGDRPSGVDTNENEYWNYYDEYYNASNNLGHTVTCVGYIPATDPLDQGPALQLGPTDWVIVHDNWASTPRNVIIPYGSPGLFNANWVANTTVEPSQHLSISNIVKVANDVFIDFTTIPSAMHHLEWMSEMTNSTWTVAVSNMPFVVGTRRVTNTVSSSVTNRFYRVKANY
jgi:hypothetical protein